ncbi:MAG: ABC transporter, partial [Gammaproteobacteria bacterium CG22_combo_CG10-13_8_21_14_all_40_8]
MSKEKLLSLEQVNFHYHTQTGFLRTENYRVFSNVTMDVYRGETLAIIGKNGVGKSTLLRLLAGILVPNSGKLTNYGASISLLSLQAGFDTQLSGIDNAYLNGMLLGATKQEITEKLPDIIAFSELGQFMYKPVKNYSAGMRARLGFSIAAVVNPDIILLDEVLGVGDSHFRKKSEAFILERIESNQTVVLVSHSSRLVTEIADRAIWIDDKTIRMQGAPDEVAA